MGIIPFPSDKFHKKERKGEFHENVEITTKGVREKYDDLKVTPGKLV